MTAICTNEDNLRGLSDAKILFAGDYAFSNPSSINGPFGTFALAVSTNNQAHGTMTINTLWGMGTVTQLVYQGTSAFNGSTGYTTVTAKGVGTVSIFPNPPIHIAVDITIALAPGLAAGQVTVSRYFTALPCKATSQIVHPGPATG
jgi:hypothetical protein